MDGVFNKWRKHLKKMDFFCNKYITFIELLYVDKELNNWCLNYSAYEKVTTHQELEKMIYSKFMKEAYELDFMSSILALKKENSYSVEEALAGNKMDIAYKICMEIRGDYWANGSLINSAIAKGDLYHLMEAFIK